MVQLVPLHLYEPSHVIKSMTSDEEIIKGASENIMVSSNQN